MCACMSQRPGMRNLPWPSTSRASAGGALFGVDAGDRPAADRHGGVRDDPSADDIDDVDAGDREGSRLGCDRDARDERRNCGKQPDRDCRTAHELLSPRRAASLTGRRASRGVRGRTRPAPSPRRPARGWRQRRPGPATETFCNVIRVLSTFITANATASPMAAPMPASRADCVITSRTTPAAVAPSAMRMPISRVRWLKRVGQHTVQPRHAQRQRDRAQQRANPRRGPQRVHLRLAHLVERHDLEHQRVGVGLPENRCAARPCPTSWRAWPLNRIAPACDPVGLVGRYRWDGSWPSKTRPLTTSPATPTMTTLPNPGRRRWRGRSMRVTWPVPGAGGSIRIRTTLPSGSAPGQRALAPAALMMPTRASERASSGAESAAADDRDAQHREVLGRDEHVRRRDDAGRHRRGHGHLGELAEQGVPAGHRDRRHAGVGGQRLGGRPDERAVLAALIHREDAGGLEPEIGRADHDAVARQRHRAHQQHQRHRHLAGHQAVAQRRGARGGAGLATQRVRQAQSRRPQGRRQREQQRRGRGDQRARKETLGDRSRAAPRAPARRSTAAASRKTGPCRRAAWPPPARAPPRRPASAISSPSVSNWRTSRPRLAPSESRIAISRWRAFARASITLETLAQAATSTRTNAAKTGDSVAISWNDSGLGVACGRASARTSARSATRAMNGVSAAWTCCRRHSRRQPGDDAQFARLIGAEQVLPGHGAIHRHRHPEIARHVVEPGKLGLHDADDDEPPRR